MNRRSLLSTLGLAALAGCATTATPTTTTPTTTTTTVQVNLATVQAEAQSLQAAFSTYVAAMGTKAPLALQTAVQASQGAVSVLLAAPASAPWQTYAKDALTALTAVAAFIPLTGPAAVAVPLGLALLSAAVSGLTTMQVPSTVVPAAAVPGRVGAPIAIPRIA